MSCMAWHGVCSVYDTLTHSTQYTTLLLQMILLLAVIFVCLIVINDVITITRYQSTHTHTHINHHLTVIWPEWRGTSVCSCVQIAMSRVYNSIKKMCLSFDVWSEKANRRMLVHESGWSKKVSVFIDEYVVLTASYDRSRYAENFTQITHNFCLTERKRRKNCLFHLTAEDTWTKNFQMTIELANFFGH